MRLDEFLKEACTGQSHLAPTHPVTFRALGLTKDREQVRIEVKARLAFVDDQTSVEISNKAHELYPDNLRAYHREVSYRMLTHALRDSENPVVQFAATVEELRKALVDPVTSWLMSEYRAFEQREFSPTPDKESLDEAEEDAEKNS